MVNSSIKKRREKILAILKEKKYISVHSLQKKLFSSEATIRRDLTKLSRLSLLKKVVGGAITIEEGGHERPLFYKERENAEKKKLIAQIAYGLVSENMTIFLDSSSTNYIFAQELVKINRLRILSNGLHTCALLSTNPTIETYCPPGKIMYRTGSILSSQTVHYISQHHADTAFLSCRGFSCDYGATDYIQEESEIKKCYIENAEKIILLVDSSKWNNNFFFQSIPINKISAIITDKRFPNNMYAFLQEKNIHVLWEL